MRVLLRAETTDAFVAAERVYTRGTLVLSAAVLVLSFLPYAAIATGNNSNLPACVIGSVVLWMIAPRSISVDLAAIGLTALPVLSFALSMLLVSPDVDFRGMIEKLTLTWPLIGGWIAIGCLKGHALPVLSWCTFLSSAYGIAQKFLFIDHGSIPFLRLYELPGYASVQAQQQVILLYVRRPFGLFPEPSYMAGTLALAAAAIVLLACVYPHRRGWLTGAALISATAAIFLSNSGGGAVAIGLIAAFYVASRIKVSRWLPIVTPFFLLGAAWAGTRVILGRQHQANFSWGDRAASIVGALRALTADPGVFLVGIGRGMSPVYFSEGRIPLQGLAYSGALPDVYSVVMRFALECGALIGIPLIIWILCGIRNGARCAVGPVGSLIAVVLWLVVAGLTISYDSASWIWVFPGMMLGLASRRAEVVESEEGP